MVIILESKHKDGFVSHDKLGAKYNMDFLLEKVVDFEIQSKSNKANTIISDRKTDQFKAIVGIMSLTGCRVTEALLLKFDDLILEESDDGSQWLTITLKNLKGSKKKQASAQNMPIKRVPILIDDKNLFFKPFVLPILKWYVQLEKWLNQGIFKNTNFLIFENWTRWMVYHYTYKYFNINPHGFRKIVTEHLVVEKNYPIKVVQKIIGHRDLKNLDYYINLRTEDIKKVVAAKSDKL